MTRQKLTRAIVPNDSEGFPRFKGKAHITQGRFRAAGIRVREVPGDTRIVGRLGRLRRGRKVPTELQFSFPPRWKRI